MALKSVHGLLASLALLLMLLHSGGVLAREFSVLTYNVYMRAPLWIFRDNHDWRAQHIPAFLRGYDVVVLQEAFSEGHRQDMLSALVEEYPHRSRLLGQDGFLSFNGGVIILSRWPILTEDQVVFNNCEGSDCIVQKGAVYVVLTVGEEKVHLVGLHLQAQKDYADARVAQFPQLQAFIERQDIPATELLLVAGDFNVDYFSRHSDGEFGRLTQSIGLVLPEDSPLPTYDHTDNSMVTDQVTERLDYVFYSSRHRLPLSASNTVLPFLREGADLSDHHAVVGRFTLGATQ